MCTDSLQLKQFAFHHTAIKLDECGDKDFAFWFSAVLTLFWKDHFYFKRKGMPVLKGKGNNKNVWKEVTVRTILSFKVFHLYKNYSGNVNNCTI
jgi:hypothetical protein